MPHSITWVSQAKVGGLQAPASAARIPADYAESTVDLIDALKLEQPDILGWSLGGYITLSLVETYPDMINRVVLADTSAGGLRGNLWHMLMHENSLCPCPCPCPLCELTQPASCRHQQQICL